MIDSHTVSKWIYRRILNYDPKVGSHGIAIAEGKAGFSGKQETKYLLCRPCEDRFGLWEDYAAQNALQADSVTFPALTSAVTIDKDATLELADASALDANVLALFAVSVFWRADVAQSDPVVDLASLREPIRLYLLGGTLPPEVDVVLTLIRPKPKSPRVDRVLVFPGTDEEDARRHEFIACGMRFTMFTALPHLSAASLPRQRRMLISEGRSILSAIAEEAQTSAAYGKLASKDRTK